MSNMNKVKPSRVAPTERVRGRTLQRIRQRVMQDQPLCRMCEEKGFVTPGAEMDHIVPLFKGGGNEDGNLQMLCVECHRKKSAIDLGVIYKPTIGLDGWPIGPQTDRAVQKSRDKLL
jgi:5-methylcytosine-specific restriction enzyme A